MTVQAFSFLHTRTLIMEDHLRIKTTCSYNFYSKHLLRHNMHGINLARWHRIDKNCICTEKFANRQLFCQRFLYCYLPSLPHPLPEDNFKKYKKKQFGLHIFINNIFKVWFLLFASKYLLLRDWYQRFVLKIFKSMSYATTVPAAIYTIQ